MRYKISFRVDVADEETGLEVHDVKLEPVEDSE